MLEKFAKLHNGYVISEMRRPAKNRFLRISNSCLSLRRSEVGWAEIFDILCNTNTASGVIAPEGKIHRPRNFDE